MKALLVGLALLLGAQCFAGVEVNLANEAELDGVKGLGPSSTARILQARQAGPFKSWPDLMTRVKGIKPAAAAKLSAAGLTVAGTPYPDASSPAAPASSPSPK